MSREGAMDSYHVLVVEDDKEILEDERRDDATI